MDFTSAFKAALPLFNILVGVVAPYFIQWMKDNPAIKFMNEDSVNLIKFLLIVVSTGLATVTTYVNGGQPDLGTDIQTVANALAVYLAAHYVYVNSIKK